MTLEILYPAQRVGDQPVSGQSAFPFYGGSPITPNPIDGGLMACTAANAISCTGLARHSRTEMLTQYEYHGTYVHGPQRVRVYSENALAITCPYDSTRTYLPGDKIYINVLGRLTNDAAYRARCVGSSITGQLPIATVLNPVPPANSPGTGLVLQLERI